MDKISIEKLRKIQIECSCGKMMEQDYFGEGSLGFIRNLICKCCGKKLVIEEGIPIG